MRVVQHGPHEWFLLQDGERYYFDARVSRSAAEWSMLVELTPQECREHRAKGELFLQYLAARMQNLPGEYAQRDLTRTLGASVLEAIDRWRSAGGGTSGMS